MLTRADIEGRKMVNAMHLDYARGLYAWYGNVEGVDRLSAARGKDADGFFLRFYVDGKKVRDLDAALAVLNGEMTIEEAMAQPERQTQPQQKPRYSIAAQITEVERELKMREKVYPRQIGAGKAFRNQAEADMHIDILKAALETLQWAKDNRADVVDWIKAGKPKPGKAA